MTGPLNEKRTAIRRAIITTEPGSNSRLDYCLAAQHDGLCNVRGRGDGAESNPPCNNTGVCGELSSRLSCSRLRDYCTSLNLAIWAGSYPAVASTSMFLQVTLPRFIGQHQSY